MASEIPLNRIINQEMDGPLLWALFILVEGGWASTRVIPPPLSPQHMNNEGGVEEESCAPVQYQNSKIIHLLINYAPTSRQWGAGGTKTRWGWPVLITIPHSCSGVLWHPRDTRKSIFFLQGTIRRVLILLRRLFRHENCSSVIAA